VGKALESLDEVLGVEEEPEDVEEAPEEVPEVGSSEAGREAGAEGGGSALGAYFSGMLKEPLVDRSPKKDSRNNLAPNLRLGVQATLLLGLLFFGFMAANGLL